MRCSPSERVLPQRWGSRSKVAAAVIAACLFARSGVSSAATITCTIVGCCSANCPAGTIPVCHKGLFGSCTCQCDEGPAVTGVNIEGIIEAVGEITVMALDISQPPDSLRPTRTLVQSTLTVTPGQSHTDFAKALAAAWKAQIRPKDSITVNVSGDAVTLESPRVAAKYLVCTGAEPCLFGDANDVDLGVEINGLSFRGLGAGEPGAEENDSSVASKLVVQPNPSRSPLISFRLRQRSAVEVSVFDLFGRRITTLVHATLRVGDYSQTWNGRDDSGRPVREGLYFCRLVVGGVTQTARVQLLR
jgi:hypothetical protein